MIGFWIIVCHLVGDYLLQSDWMAQNKRRSSVAAAVHAFTYSLPFLLLQPSFWAVVLICETHYFIDRYGLARYVVWAKNWLGRKEEWYLSTLVPAGGSEIYVAGRDLEELYPAGREANGVITKQEAKMCRTPPWKYCRETGYPPSTPQWLSTWLVIIADNTLHLIIAGAALTWL